MIDERKGVTKNIKYYASCEKPISVLGGNGGMRPLTEIPRFPP